MRQLSNSLQKDGSFKESKDEEQNNNNNNNNSSSSNNNNKDSSNNGGSNTVVANSEIPRPHGFNKRFLKSLRYLRQEPTVIKYDTGSNSSIEVPAGLTYDDGIERFELMVKNSSELRNRKVSHYDGPGKRAKPNKTMEVSYETAGGHN